MAGQGGELMAMKTEAISWDNNSRKVIALCNDLVPRPQGMLAGPQDEERAFQSVEAVFVVWLLLFCLNV